MLISHCYNHSSLLSANTNRETQLGWQSRTANWRYVCRAQSNKSTYKMVNKAQHHTNCFSTHFLFRSAKSQQCLDFVVGKTSEWTTQTQPCCSSERGPEIGAAAAEGGDRADGQPDDDELRRTAAPVRWWQSAGLPPPQPSNAAVPGDAAAPQPAVAPSADAAAAAGGAQPQRERAGGASSRSVALGWWRVVGEQQQLMIRPAATEASCMLSSSLEEVGGVCHVWMIEDIDILYVR